MLLDVLDVLDLDLAPVLDLASVLALALVLVLVLLLAVVLALCSCSCSCSYPCLSPSSPPRHDYCVLLHWSDSRGRHTASSMYVHTYEYQPTYLHGLSVAWVSRYLPSTARHGAINGLALPAMLMRVRGRETL